MKAQRKSFDLVPEGNHVARLYQIIHIGTINKAWQGEDKIVDTVRLMFELCNEKKEFKPGEGEKPFSIAQEYSLSMNSKSNLRKAAEGLIGKALKDDDAYDLDIETLLGKACLLNVVHKETANGVYANIASISPMLKGVTVPEIVNEPKFIDVNEAAKEELDVLPNFIKEKIQSSEEYGIRFLGKGVSEEASLEMLDDTGKVPADEEPF